MWEFNHIPVTCTTGYRGGKNLKNVRFLPPPTPYIYPHFPLPVFPGVDRVAIHPPPLPLCRNKTKNWKRLSTLWQKEVQTHWKGTSLLCLLCGIARISCETVSNLISFINIDWNIFDSATPRYHSSLKNTGSTSVFCHLINHKNKIDLSIWLYL